MGFKIYDPRYVYAVVGYGGGVRLGRIGSHESSVYIMGEDLRIVLFILFVIFSGPLRVTGEQQQSDDPSTPDLCVPHSPKVNCSYL